jgi:hypothetical protein
MKNFLGAERNSDILENVEQSRGLVRGEIARSASAAPVTRVEAGGQFRQMGRSRQHIGSARIQDPHMPLRSAAWSNTTTGSPVGTECRSTSMEPSASRSPAAMRSRTSSVPVGAGAPSSTSPISNPPG